ncbi:hypothetical protein LINPERPRIM_LOCUS14338 [Linum perenne]
MRKNNFS